MDAIERDALKEQLGEAKIIIEDASRVRCDRWCCRHDGDHCLVWSANWWLAKLSEKGGG